MPDLHPAFDPETWSQAAAEEVFDEALAGEAVHVQLAALVGEVADLKALLVTQGAMLNTVLHALDGVAVLWLQRP